MGTSTSFMPSCKCPSVWKIWMENVTVTWTGYQYIVGSERGGCDRYLHWISVHCTVMQVPISVNWKKDMTVACIKDFIYSFIYEVFACIGYQWIVCAIVQMPIYTKICLHGRHDRCLCWVPVKVRSVLESTWKSLGFESPLSSTWKSVNKRCSS